MILRHNNITVAQPKDNVVCIGHPSINERTVKQKNIMQNIHNIMFQKLYFLIISMI